MPHKTPEALGRNGFKVGTLQFIMCPEVPHVPRWRFFQAFFKLLLSWLACWIRWRRLQAGSAIEPPAGDMGPEERAG